MNDKHQERQWFIVSRWHEYDAEIRASYVRMFAIVSFYAVQLYDFAVRKATTVEFHRAITALTVAWMAVSILALWCVSRRYLPSWLKFATTIADIVLLTAALLTAAGPQSPLIAGYFLVLIVAAMRFSLRLVWVSTLGCLVSYVVVLACCHPDWFGTEARSYTVPRREQLIVAVAIGCAGIALGQIVRRVKSIAAEFVRRIERGPQ